MPRVQAIKTVGVHRRGAIFNVTQRQAHLLSIIRAAVILPDEPEDLPMQSQAQTAEEAAPVRRGRGRPRKVKADNTVTAGSENVFADIGVPAPDERLQQAAAEADAHPEAPPNPGYTWVEPLADPFKPPVAAAEPPAETDAPVESQVEATQEPEPTPAEASAEPVAAAEPPPKPAGLGAMSTRTPGLSRSSRSLF